MALSNWDTFAMNEKGEPCKGEFVSPLGIEVSIYKNWIYIKDKKAWQKGAFTEPTVMEVFSSLLRYKDITLISKTEFGTIYMIVWSGDSENNNLKGMIGIGASGFSRKNFDYVGITDKQLNKLKKFLNKEYVVGWYDIPEQLKNIDLSKGNRFNQGDMFFSETIGTDKNCSDIGNASTPTIMKMMEKEKKI